MVATWNKLVANGIETGMDIRFSKKIKITNQISLALSFIAFCYVFIFSFAGFVTQGLWLIAGVLALHLCVFFNYKKWYILARLLCFTTVIVAVYIYAVIFGKDAGIQLVFFPCTCLPWIFFSPKDWKYIASLTAISIVCYFSYYLTNGLPMVAITPATQKFFCITIMSVVFIYIYLCMRFLSIQNHKSEQFLTDTYQKFFEDIPTPMWIFDESSMNFLTVNQNAIKSYGYSKAEFLDMVITDISPLEEIADSEKAIQNESVDYGFDGGYTLHRKKNGNVFYAHILTNRTLYNGIKARVVQAIDVNDKIVTERSLEELKLSQEKLKIQGGELRETIKQKNVINKQLERFTYVVAHEIKSPLNNVFTLIDILQNDERMLNEESFQELTNELVSLVSHMSKMIDSILDYSKKSENDIPEEIVDVYEMVLGISQLHNKNKQIRILPHGNLPCITTRKLKLQQVFQNLISNAVKYMDKEQGEIVIGHEDEEDFHKFHVKDNGPGIPEKDIKRIFYLFETTDNVATNSDSKTGVGLNILKMLVEEQGGKVSVESVPGSGSTFYFQWRK